MGNQNKKQNIAGGGLYIALAICVLSVICIGVYSAILNVFQTPSLEPVEESVNRRGNTSPGIVVETPPVTGGSDAPAGIRSETETPVENPLPDETPEQNVNAAPVAPTYTMPVAGDVSADYSDDVLVYSETMNDYRIHTGVDLATTLGTPVRAFTDGVVLEISEDPLMGQTVVLDHGNDMKSVYWNLSPVLPEEIVVGARVKEGEIIGGVGETALIECAQTPHLHFEVLVDGKNVDPMSYFR